MPESVNAEFEKCVKRSRCGEAITCRLGLWSVFGLIKDDLEREATHYWIQYRDDGEYDELLGIKPNQ